MCAAVRLLAGYVVPSLRTEHVCVVAIGLLVIDYYQCVQRAQPVPVFIVEPPGRVFAACAKPGPTREVPRCAPLRQLSVVCSCLRRFLGRRPIPAHRANTTRFVKRIAARILGDDRGSIHSLLAKTSSPEDRHFFGTGNPLPPQCGRHIDISAPCLAHRLGHQAREPAPSHYASSPALEGTSARFEPPIKSEHARPPSLLFSAKSAKVLRDRAQKNRDLVARPGFSRV